jgi:hypothetical protein
MVLEWTYFSNGSHGRWQSIEELAIRTNVDQINFIAFAEDATLLTDSDEEEALWFWSTAVRVNEHFDDGMNEDEVKSEQHYSDFERIKENEGWWYN